MSDPHRICFSSEDNGELDEEMSLPLCPFDPQPVSICPSETEEAATDHEDDLDDLDEPEEVDEQDNAEEEEEEDDDEEEGCTCGETCWKCVPSTSTSSQREPSNADATAMPTAAAAPLPADAEFAPARVAKVGAATGENIDEIVQDHDNFGTDENEDSLDSLAMASGAISVSLYRPDSEDSIEDESSLFGAAAKRKNVDETDRTNDSEPIVKKKKKSSLLSLSDKSFELQWNSDNKEPPQQQPQQQRDQERDREQLGSAASDSLTKPGNQDEEQHHVHQLPHQQLFLAGDHNLEHEVCSPQPSDGHATCSTPTCSKAPAVVAADDGEAEQLLPPPSAAIVSWVDTFSRWSHADKIVAIDQLISACHPTQVRHMMAVIEPQFQRDFISLLPKEVYFLLHLSSLLIFYYWGITVVIIASGPRGHEFKSCCSLCFLITSAL